ncbi:hypothetical protein TIFTF001_035492 [Ficus carica]|uniref:Uncharacterized protein n=1 Tax=Ficus carica TaxID=3494 RepID=A0AA88E4X2_FICCA|nr:hypothetical protein TIFTF001_035492 [Ficus carica]
MRVVDGKWSSLQDIHGYRRAIAEQRAPCREPPSLRRCNHFSSLSFASPIEAPPSRANGKLAKWNLRSAGMQVVDSVPAILQTRLL